MEYSDGRSPSLSFPISSYLSDAFSSDYVPPYASYDVETNPELSSCELSFCLEKLLIGGEYDRYNDTVIEVGGVAVGVNRGILAARSLFFHELFKNVNDNSENICKQKYLLSDLVPHGRIGYEAFMVVLHFLYTGKTKESPVEVSTCVDLSCCHDDCGPAIGYEVEKMYASSTFQIKELVMTVQHRLITFADKAFVEDVIPILIVAFRCNLEQLLARCVKRVAQSDLGNIVMEKEIPHEVFVGIKSKQDEVNQKNIRRIHKALESGDIELVELFLKESDITLDSACALHYAAAYCNPKTVIGLLNLKIADVNLRNSRGHTALHVAARRKDPSIVIELLRYGASPFDTTVVGRHTSVTICRRLTRLKDFNEETIECRNSNEDRLCINMLEIEMQSKSHPLASNVSMSAMMAANELCMELLFFENRVALARHLFPLEAKLAMQVAEVNSTIEFSGTSDENTGEVDPNESISEHDKNRWQRLIALKKTVATGRHYFPICSEVLDRCLDDEISGPLLLDTGTPEERQRKKARYMELKAELIKAMNKDKAQHKRAASLLTSSHGDSGKVGKRMTR